MAVITILQHSDIGAGRIAAALRDHGFRLDIRRVDLAAAEGGRAVPPDLDNVDGVVSLGGPQNVGDPLPWLEEEAAFLRKAHAAKLPVIGICLGAQLLAHALGGKVGRMERPEVGFHRLLINPAGQIETIFAGIAWESPQLQTHGFEVKELPPGAMLLASSKQCRVQAFKVGLRSYGFQFHPEADMPMVERYIAQSAEEMRAAGLTAAEFKAQAERDYADYARLSDRLAVNIVTYAFPYSLVLSG